MADTNHARQLFTKIEDKRAHLDVIDLGRFALPLALACAEKGLQVFGFDVDPATVEQLTAGEF